MCHVFLSTIPIAMMDCGSPQGVYLNTRSHANLAAQQYQHLTTGVSQYPSRGSEGSSSNNSKHPQRLSTSAMDSSMDTSRSYSHQHQQHKMNKASSNAITVPSSFDETMIIQPALYALEATSVALSPLSPPNMQFDPTANHQRTMPGGIVYNRSYSSPQGDSLHAHGGRGVAQFYGTNASLFAPHENGLPPSKQFTFQLGERNSNPYHHQGGTGTGNNSNSDSCTHSPMMQGVVVQN